METGKVIIGEKGLNKAGYKLRKTKSENHKAKSKPNKANQELRKSK